jgi:hypothetical protein
VNPYQWLEEMYSRRTLERYAQGVNGAHSGGNYLSLAPHIFVAARECFLGLRDSGATQAIIISGVSHQQHRHHHHASTSSLSSSSSSRGVKGERLTKPIVAILICRTKSFGAATQGG